MSKVSPRRLGDLITLKRGYDLPEKDRIPGPYPVISSAGVSGFHNEYKVEGQGVVTGRYGTLGEMYFVEDKYWPHNTALYVQNFKGNDPKYIYYLLSCLGRIRTSDKSAVPGVNRNELHEMAIPAIDDRKLQVAIRKVLEAIDKKIELNNRINAELEAMAKTLYDYWFVQFDFPGDSPQGQGKPYKTSGGKMVYNPTLKREIPEGWSVVPLKKLVHLVKGNVSPSEIDPSTPYVGLEHIQRKRLALEDWASSDTAESDKTVFEKGDILFGKIRPYFHKVTVAPFDGITSTDTLIFRPSSKNYFGVALEVIFSEEFVLLASQSSTGSKMPRADWNVLNKYPVAIPRESLLERFQVQIEKVLDHLNLTTLENRELRELRDWLLPMLMNGQVTVE